MNKPGTHKRSGWQAWPVLVAALFWLPGGVAQGQASNPALTRLVRPAPGTRPLGAVLAELARQGHLPLSYSSSLVPVAHECTLRPGPARPLGVVLREVLAAEHLSYGLLNGQLVLWPARLTAPVGVTAANGRPTPVIQLIQPPAQLGTSAAAASALGAAAVAAKPTAAGHRAGSRPAAPAGQGELAVSGPAKPARATAASRNYPANGRLASGTGTTAAMAVQAGLASRPQPGRQALRSLAPAKQVTARPSTETAAAASLRGNQSRARLGKQSQRARPEAALSVSTAAAHHARYRPSQLRGPIDLLPFLRSSPTAARASGEVVPAALTPAPGQSALASAAQAADPAKKPFALASLLHPSYLHGEAWGSESLPFNAAVKVGIPRIYLVLGVAAGPFDHQSGGAAWGVGLGTAGRPRGRFTPSLDVLHWFLSGPGGDRDAPHDQLTQLRPALAWQFKQGGRWQLVGGPTLNLATGRRPPGPGPGPFRWPLGQHQWLWVNSDDGPSLLRLWPGVQLGVRF